MKKEARKSLFIGIALILAFALWTILVLTVDVRAVGVNGSTVGFAGVNLWVKNFTELNPTLYVVTDWLGLVPLFVCFFFGFFGLIQLIRRKSLLRVDLDIVLLGIYYIIVIAEYLIFEMVPINYRPVLINGFMEVSYPSSTTLLVLSVMPTLVFQAKHRLRSITIKRIVTVASAAFSAFMVIGRLVSGVHWVTDIVGSILISAGLFCVYKALADWREERGV